METLPTLNSKNFKYVKCPTCEKYPSRWNSRRTTVPRIVFPGIRWNAEMHQVEIQGHCEHCYKEFRVLIEGIDGQTLSLITLVNPKVGETIGPVSDHLRR